MRTRVTMANRMIQAASHIICRLDTSELSRVPSRGPLIIVSNHVNFLEIPIVRSHLHPRQITGFAKVETWKNPLLGALFDLWEAIPLERGSADVKAFQLALRALEHNKIVAVAPEGTRSGNGCLQPGKSGVVILALHSRAPLLPMVFYGGELFWDNIKRLRRTDFRVVVGKPFRIEINDASPSKETRQLITDEIMNRLAELLPIQYRGYYREPEKVHYRFLKDAYG